MKKTMLGGAILVCCVASAEFNASTLAFYGFSGVPDGAAATSEGALTNEVSSLYFGTGHEDEFGNVTFDADAPGEYVFDGSIRKDSVPLCTSPASVRITSASADPASGGYLKFPGLQSALSQLDSGTIEFFWKIPEDERSPLQYKTAFGLDACVNESGSRVRVGVSLPLALSDGKFTDVSLSHSSMSGWGGSAAYPVAQSASAWHHIALVFTNDGYSCSFSIYSDYRYATSISGSYTMDKLETSTPLLLGRSFRNANNTPGFHGKISCVRVSSRALTTGEFLHASDSLAPKVMFGDETIAFYSFSEAEGRDGETAHNYVLLNDTSEGSFGGKANKGSGSIVFSDDAPGAYVFTNLQNGADIVAVNPRSIKLNKANINFADIGTELSKHDESTLEFFWKIPSDASALGFNIKTSLCSGMTNSVGTAATFGLMFPMGAPGSSVDWTTYVRFCDSENLNLNSIERIYPASTVDGKWHHIAVVYDHGQFRLYADYVKASLDCNGFWPRPLQTSEPFTFGRERYIGSISCLRVSSKALPPEQMLRVSSRTDCVPNEIFSHRFEGAQDATLSGAISNDSASYGTINPGVYFEDVVCRVVKESADPAPQISNARWKPMIKTAVGSASVANRTSVHCQVTAAPSQVDTFASGTGFQFEQDLLQPSTLEFFARLDYDGYVSSIAAATAVDRVALASSVNSSARALWSLVVSRVKEDDVKLLLYTYTYDDSDKMTINQQSFHLDPGDFREKWHRYAVTNDPSRKEMSVWYDGVCVMTGTADGMKVTSSNTCTIGCANSFNAFCGWFDEFRYSRVLLPENKMQFPFRPPGTTIVIH